MSSKVASYAPPENLIFPSKNREEDERRYRTERGTHYCMLLFLGEKNSELGRRLVSLDKFFEIRDEFTKIFEKAQSI